MGGSSPCASCKLLRRRCTQECIFAPYFPSDDPRKFAIVHKVFGASNISKMLQVYISLTLPDPLPHLYFFRDELTIQIKATSRLKIGVKVSSFEPLKSWK